MTTLSFGRHTSADNMVATWMDTRRTAAELAGRDNRPSRLHEFRRQVETIRQFVGRADHYVEWVERSWLDLSAADKQHLIAWAYESEQPMTGEHTQRPARAPLLESIALRLLVAWNAPTLRSLITQAELAFFHIGDEILSHAEMESPDYQAMVTGRLESVDDENSSVNLSRARGEIPEHAEQALGYRAWRSSAGSQSK